MLEWVFLLARADSGSEIGDTGRKWFDFDLDLGEERLCVISERGRTLGDRRPLDEPEMLALSLV